jgi:hypothetical protein
VKDPIRDLSFMLLADAPLLPWLSLRGRGWVQQVLPNVGPLARTRPTSIMADLAVTGQL